MYGRDDEREWRARRPQRAEVGPAARLASYLVLAALCGALGAGGALYFYFGGDTGLGSDHRRSSRQVARVTAATPAGAKAWALAGAVIGVAIGLGVARASDLPAKRKEP